MTGYKVNRPQKSNRVIVCMGSDELAQLDAWGVSRGMPSRSATIRNLISMVSKEAGLDLGGTAPASETKTAALECSVSTHNG